MKLEIFQGCGKNSFRRYFFFLCKTGRESEQVITAIIYENSYQTIHQLSHITVCHDIQVWQPSDTTSCFTELVLDVIIHGRVNV